jgi:hypothetical protein
MKPKTLQITEDGRVAQQQRNVEESMATFKCLRHFIHTFSSSPASHFDYIEYFYWLNATLIVGIPTSALE